LIAGQIGARHSVKEAAYCLCSNLSFAEGLARGITACGAVVILELDDLVGVRTTKQRHSLAVLKMAEAS
jgi:hypothetical protein